MLERVALHQSRFRTPGVAPDARGVLIGSRGAVLFPSLDRLVAFLRAWGAEGSLEELLGNLEIRRVKTPLGTREILLLCAAESSRRMDRIAGLARLCGALAFTGTSRHYVQYRDAASPLGYDVDSLSDERADAILYADAFRQPYAFDREIRFTDLIVRLAPVPALARDRRTPERIFVTAEPGIGAALVRYLFRWQVDARAGLAELPRGSAFDDAARRLHFFDARAVPPRIVSLLASLPGVCVFEPVSEAFGVQLGFAHPLALESCGRPFGASALHLLRADGGVLALDPPPPLAHVRTLVRASVDLEGASRDARRAAAKEIAADLSLTLRLAPTIEPPRNVTATIVPAEQAAWLAAVLYKMPPRALAALRIATGSGRIFLLDAGGIEGVPLGTYYSEAASRVFVPVGFALVPAVGREVLLELVRDRGEGAVFFEPGSEAPIVVPSSAFGPLLRRSIAPVLGLPIDASAPEEDEPPLPLLEYGPVHTFPLWGVPKDEPAAPPDAAKDGGAVDGDDGGER